MICDSYCFSLLCLIKSIVITMHFLHHSVCSLCNLIGQFPSIYHLHLLSLRQSASQEEGYDKVTWTSDTETHPPWLRFHLGISRWELYNRKDPNLAQLTHYLATQHIHSAGEQMRGVGQGGGMTAQCKRGGTINVVCYQHVKYADLHFVSYLGGTFITVKQGCNAQHTKIWLRTWPRLYAVLSLKC